MNSARLAIKTLPTCAIIRGLLHYNPETGKLSWLPRPREMFKNEHEFRRWNTRYANKTAGNVNPKTGYLVTAIFDVQYQTHRLIWSYVFGEPIPPLIDHADGDKLNNRIDNLRAATRAENRANSVRPITNRSGVKGVWLSKKGKFTARITSNGKQTHIGGAFASVEDAAKARFEAAARLHGRFARND